jgi:hypothetical protein
VTFPATSYGTNGNVPQQTFQKKWQIKDSLSWTRGSHNWRFGGDWVFEPWLGGFFGYVPVPALTFFHNPTTILDNKTLYPQGFSTPGILSNLAVTNGITYSRYTYPNYIYAYGWYVQDDWRVSRKLTLNLGLRWDADIGLVGPDILNNCRTYLIVQKINDPLTNGFKSIPKDDTNNFAPRFGFAYDPTGQGKTVIRGGYGMYYDQLFNNINLFAMQQSFEQIFGRVFDESKASLTDQTGPLANWVVNVTPLPTPDPSKPLVDLPNNSAGRLMDPNYVSPLSQQFNIGFSHEFLKDFVLEADYTHLLNTHESRRIRLNYRVVLPDGSNPRRLASAFVAAGMPSNRLADITNDLSTNRSRYDGLNIGVRKRLSHRLSFQTSYTLSRALGYGGRSGEFGALAAYDQANYLDPRELAYTVRDERHRFAFSGIVDLPWGFQVGPVIQLASARPYSLTTSIDLNKDGVSSSTTNAAGADPCTPGTASTNGRACPQGVGINTQRGGYDLDGNWQSGRFFLVDLRVSKFINLSMVREGMNLGFYFETFNLTNRTNFGNNFQGLVTSSQFQSTRGLATTAYGINIAAPFQAQLGVRFSF